MMSERAQYLTDNSPSQMLAALSETALYFSFFPSKHADGHKDVKNGYHIGSLITGRTHAVAR